jgi:adenylate cyclase
VARPSEPVRELLRSLGASDDEIDDAADVGVGALVALGARGLLTEPAETDQQPEPEPVRTVEPLAEREETELVELLRSLGASNDEIERARRDGSSALFALVADRLFVPGTERLTRRQVAAQSGIPPEEASVYWRAMGFADVSDDDPIFTEVDAEMLTLLKNLLQSGFLDRDVTLQMTRVMGRSMSSVAAAQVDIVRQLSGGLPVAAARREGVAALVQVRNVLLEIIERSLVYMWRRHMAAEARRAALAIEESAGEYTVGFADLVGFTALSAQMDESTLATAVSRFESTAVEIVAGLQGRVVKMIGDEVMFESLSPADGVETGLRLVEAFTEDDTLPDVRAGVAEGVATPYQGDLFGPAPNLAHRLVDVAYPASVLVSASVQHVLEEDPRYEFHPVRPQVLKGFGRTRFWVARRKPE